MVLVASGGMYSERLDVAGLGMPEGYDGVKVYARAKRAQVTLAARVGAAAARPAGGW